MTARHAIHVVMTAAQLSQVESFGLAVEKLWLTKVAGQGAKRTLCQRQLHFGVAQPLAKDTKST